MVIIVNVKPLFMKHGNMAAWQHSSMESSIADFFQLYNDIHCGMVLSHAAEQPTGHPQIINISSLAGPYLCDL